MSDMDAVRESGVVNRTRLEMHEINREVFPARSVRARWEDGMWKRFQRNEDEQNQNHLRLWGDRLDHRTRKYKNHMNAVVRECRRIMRMRENYNRGVQRARESESAEVSNV